MAQRVVRYDARFDAQVLLEELVVEEWIAVDGRGFESVTAQGSRIQVFPENHKVLVFGEVGVSLDELEVVVRSLLEGGGVPNRNLIPFIDPDDCKSRHRQLQDLSEQLNECYAIKAYDAVAVLMRRIVESLIIECFEANQLAAQIRKPDGSYFMLNELIVEAERVNQNNGWRLTAKTRQVLPLVKDVGDQAAHGRFYCTKKKDVDDLKHRFSIAIADLKHISNLE